MLNIVNAVAKRIIHKSEHALEVTETCEVEREDLKAQN
jgi:hypothetical protein